MSANSLIQWTDHTFNPWIGCTKVSPGCANCYAETEDKRRGWTPEGWGKGKPRMRTSATYWKQARKWNAYSVEDQRRADERIPLLLQTPAAIRFLSCEPLLGPVDLASKYIDDGWSASRCELHWIIVGGESGTKARPCNVDWIRDIVAQCKAAGVPTFVKQLGANIVDRNDVGYDGDSPVEWPMDTNTRDIDSGYQGAPVRVLLKDRKGGNPVEWPEDLRVREFPTTEVAA